MFYSLSLWERPVASSVESAGERVFVLLLSQRQAECETADHIRP